MKKVITVCVIMFFSFPLGLLAKNVTNHHSLKPIVNEIKLTHTYVRVFADGAWWIYEYDEDGRLVNIYAAEE